MSDELQIRLMTADDFEFADSLRAAVGWNQTLHDWRRLLALEPGGCFVVEWKGQRVGTGTTTCYGNELAWIGMIITHPDFRRLGIGKAMMNHCIAHLQAKPIRCIKLDATPLGKPLYLQLGFQEEWSLARWQTESPQIPKCNTGRLRQLHSFDWAALADVDENAFGVRRRRQLELLGRQSRGAWLAEREGRVTGYGMWREGTRANYLGPIVCESDDDALPLVAQLLSEARGRTVYWDVPGATTSAVEIAKQCGFAQQRPLIRMFLGENAKPGIPTKQFAIAGPTTG